MNNKFKGLYDTEGTSFISDKVETINYYQPTIKTSGVQNHTYSINFDKTELYKEIETLQQELQRKDNIINELEEYLDKEINKLDVPKLENLSELHRIVRLEAINNILDKIQELENDIK